MSKEVQKNDENVKRNTFTLEDMRYVKIQQILVNPKRIVRRNLHLNETTKIWLSKFVLFHFGICRLFFRKKFLICLALLRSRKTLLAFAKDLVCTKAGRQTKLQRFQLLFFISAQKCPKNVALPATVSHCFMATSKNK